MKKAILFLIVTSLVLVACGGLGSKEPPLEERILGTWSGAQTNADGDKIPATWEFLEGGTMVIKIFGLDMAFGATWSVEGNRINFVLELDSENPTYRDVEFVSDDVIKLTKAEGDIVETWTRIEAE